MQPREDVGFVAIQPQRHRPGRFEIAQSGGHRSNVGPRTTRWIDQIDEKMRPLGNLREHILLEQLPHRGHVRIERPVGERDDLRRAASGDEPSVR